MYGEKKECFAVVDVVYSVPPPQILGFFRDMLICCRKNRELLPWVIMRYFGAISGWYWPTMLKTKKQKTKSAAMSVGGRRHHEHCWLTFHSVFVESDDERKEK